MPDAQKSLYLEGLIRFLEIYAETEIGGEIELDIAKIALFVNSATFENDDLYSIHTVEDVYRLCEELALLGLPLWRFLKLSDYQKRIFESGYHELLLSLKKKSTDEKSCYGCIWYRETETMFGILRECKRPETSLSDMWKASRHTAFIPEEHSDCPWATTLDSIPEEVYQLPNEGLSRRRIQDNFLAAVEPARERFRKELEKDPFRIPKEMSEDEIIDLSVTPTLDDALVDFAFAFKNKRTVTERRRELQKAMLLESMIRFFTIYAETEYGTDYQADITAIALFVDELEPADINHITKSEHCYTEIEEKYLTYANNFVKCMQQ